MAKQQQRGATKAKAAVEQGQEEDQQSQREQQTKVPAERGAGEPTRDRPQFQPRVDIYEKGNGLVLVADLPGVSTNGLEVTLEKRVLTVYGRVEEDRPEGYSPVYHEYDIGDFERQFTLAGDFDVDGIQADLDEGVLRLTIPRAPEPAAKRIQVKASP